MKEGDRNRVNFEFNSKAEKKHSKWSRLSYACTSFRMNKAQPDRKKNGFILRRFGHVHFLSCIFPSKVSHHFSSFDMRFLLSWDSVFVRFTSVCMYLLLWFFFFFSFFYTYISYTIKYIYTHWHCLFLSIILLRLFILYMCALYTCTDENNIQKRNRLECVLVCACACIRISQQFENDPKKVQESHSHIFISVAHLPYA